jgi:hypothetical protein
LYVGFFITELKNLFVGYGLETFEVIKVGSGGIECEGTEILKEELSVG